MKVTDIQNPDFLKDLSNQQLKELAADIRKFMIESLSKTGGHLASNLGVVELTIALYKMFDMPKDKLIFDVGHQCYPHKILTGRSKDFPTLRKYEGLSGFIKKSESEYDCWEAGHSSTSLSAALGMAIARDLDGEDYAVIPLIGDGSITNGMALEALNQIGDLKSKVIIIFNDNQMSINQNTGILKNTFKNLRMSKIYNSSKNELKDNLNGNKFTEGILNSLINIKNNVKHTVIDGGIFDDFEIDYVGPIDGHNFEEIFKALNIAKAKDGPVIIHAITTKGKGYEFCDNDISGKWHGVGPFDIKSGKMLASKAKGHESYSKIVNNVLMDYASFDKDLVVLTPAMVSGSKLDNFFAKYPQRSFDCGIAEEHCMTLAAGLANANKKPFVSIYSSFLQRAYDQLNHDVIRQGLNVTIGIDRAGLVGADGATHHGVFDISILRSLPDLIIAQAKDGQELQNLIYSSLEYNGPYAVRYPRGEVEYHKLDKYENIKVGEWTLENYNELNNITVLTYGENVVKVGETVKNNNLKVNVVNCRFIKPLDINTLNKIFKTSKNIIVYESDIKIGGFGDAILNFKNENNYLNNIQIIGIDDHYTSHGAIKNLKELEKIDLNSLFNIISELE